VTRSPEAERALAAASDAADSARAVHAQAVAVVTAAEAELREAERWLRWLRNAETAVSAADMAVRVEARMMRIAFTEEIETLLQPAVRSAQEAEASVAGDLQHAEAALERATAVLAAIHEAYDAPLTHPRAACARLVYAARSCEAAIAEPDAAIFTAEHRASAMTCLSRVLRLPVAQKMALDVAARIAENRIFRPQLERLPDGNWRVMDYSSLAQPRDANLVRQAEDARSAASLTAAAVADLREPALGKLLADTR